MYITYFCCIKNVFRQYLCLIALATALVFLAPVNHDMTASAQKCHDNSGTLKWSGTDHGDNKPSSHKAKQMINDGASLCQLAKACDHMDIALDINSKAKLHTATFYQQASDEQKKELDHAMKDGVGANGMKCYELEYAASE